MSLPCSFCDRVSAYQLPGEGRCCGSCAALLGVLIGERDVRAARHWPALVEVDGDEAGPEPMVRLGDGSRVELRARTLALKAELTAAQRAQLAHSYVELGMFGEAVLEAAHVLSAAGAPAEAVEGALGVLFAPPLAPVEPSGLRALLQPH